MKVVNKKYGKFLIFVTCFAYSVAYLLRYSFAANTIAIARELEFSNDELGLISSFLFFSYGFGQIINSFLAKKYNPKIIFTLGMSVSVVCNVLFLFARTIPFMCGLWLVNGLFQSLLWCNVANVQAKYISQSQIDACVLFDGFTYCFGTCVIYGLSSLFIDINWQITFYIVSVIGIITVILWFISVTVAEKMEKEEDVLVNNIEGVTKNESEKPIKLFTKYFCFIFVFEILIALLISFIRDGVTTWLPKILADCFGISDEYSTLTVMLIAILSVLGVMLAKSLEYKIKGHLILQSVFIIITEALLISGIVFFNIKSVIPFIIVFVLAVCLVYGVTNIITNQIPFRIRAYGNVGSFSTMLDAFCYVGSMIATYVFGAVSESYGWLSVLIIISVIGLLAFIIAIVGGILAKKQPLTKEVF